MKRIAQGTHSTVYHLSWSELDPEIRRQFDDRHDQDADALEQRSRGYCIKSVPVEMAVLSPHDVHQEIHLLRSLNHPNIIRLLHHTLTPHPQRKAWELVFPCYKWTLQDLLDDPRFAPVDYPGAGDITEPRDENEPGDAQFGSSAEQKGRVDFLDGLLQERQQERGRDGLPAKLPPPSILSQEFGLDLPPSRAPSPLPRTSSTPYKPPSRLQTFDHIATIITAQLVDALSYLHARGIAHRDIKPSNVLLDIIDEDGGVGSGTGRSAQELRAVDLDINSSNPATSGTGLSPASFPSSTGIRLPRITVKLIDFGISLQPSLGESSARSRSAAGSHVTQQSGAGVDGVEQDGLDVIEDEDLDWKGKGEGFVLQVGSGTYRPPELLFSHTQYDPYALDSWALGCTLAGFFTGFVWLPEGNGDGNHDEMEGVGCAADEADGERSDERGREGYKVRRPRDEEEDSEDESEDSESDELDGPIVPLFHRNSKTNIKQKTTPRPAAHHVAPSDHTRGRWKRQTLFDGESGEIGLAWSIFRVMGTPGSEGGGEWKSFDSLPDAGKVSFEPRRKVPLVDVLPFLSQDDDCDDHTQKDDADDDGVAGVNWSGVLNSLIRLEPSERSTMTRLWESLWSRDTSEL